MKRAFFLDRDGIINQVIYRKHGLSSPYSVRELQFMPRIHDLVNELKARGFMIIVATNQPDVERGRFTEESLCEIHRVIGSALEIDEVFVCTSSDDSHSNRKPNPGMLLDAAKKHGISLKDSFFIGDGVKDIEAGRNAGVTTVLLETDYNVQHHGIADLNVKDFTELIDNLK